MRDLGERDRLVLCGKMVCIALGLTDENNSPDGVRYRINLLASAVQSAIELTSGLTCITAEQDAKLNQARDELIAARSVTR